MKEYKIITTLYEYDSVSELSEQEQELVKRAKKAVSRSYAPYSKFNVGAALLLDNGEIIEGNNQENSAYPSGLCAERVAIFYANSMYPDNRVATIAITSFSNGRFSSFPIPPCGACRQVLLETEERYKQPLKVLLCGEEKIVQINSVKDLLPIHFEKAMLE